MPTIYNKVALDGTTLLDLSQDTASSASHIRNGYTAHLNDGTQVTGTYSGGSPSLQTKTKTYTPTTSQQTESVSADSGYDGLSAVNVTVNAMPTGSLVAAGTYSITNPTIDVGETGSIAVTGESHQIVNPVYTSGYIDTSATQYVTATVYGTYQLPSARQFAGFNAEFITLNNVRKWNATTSTIVDPEEGCSAGWLSEGVYEGISNTYNAVPSGTTITPTKSSQTIGGARYMMEGAVTVNPIPSQYIVPSGTLSVSDNGTTDCTNYANVTVNIPFVTYYTGSSAPSSSLGSDGDIYLKTV